MRVWCGLNKHPRSRFVGFDSFEGLPEDWLPGFPKGAFGTAGQLPDIPDIRVRFEAGWFQNTVPNFLSSDEQRADCPLIIHCDSDLYSSTLFCLASLNGIIRTGTIIIFDEFGAVLD